MAPLSQSSLNSGNFPTSFEKLQNSQRGLRFPGRKNLQFFLDIGFGEFETTRNECGMRAEGYGLTTHAVLSTPLAALACMCVRSFEGKSG